MSRLLCRILLLSCVALGCESPLQRPNVLILVWDTVRADRCSAYGHAPQTTPQLERMAAEGVLYANAISPGIRTVPSHASLFTGLPIGAHGVDSSERKLDDVYETLAESFSKAGYETFAAISNVYISQKTNLVQGFGTVRYSWQPPLEDASFKHFRSKLISGDSETVAWLNSGADKAQHCKEAAPVLNEELLRWLDEEAGAEPFFAYVNYMEAHIPLIPSESTRRRFMDENQYEESLKLDRSAKSQFLYCVGALEYDSVQLDLNRRLYDASLFELDQALGQLLDGLKDRKLLDETIVVVVSDHGESLGESHILGHRFSIHEALVRVPLVMRYPRTLRPARVEQIVNTLDLHATLLGLAGIPGPSSASRILPVADADSVTSSIVVAEAPEASQAWIQHDELEGVAPVHFLRDLVAAYSGDLKLVRIEGHGDQLFDLSLDPLETIDVSKSLPNDLARISTLLDLWQSELEALRDPRAGEPEPAEFSEEDRQRLEALGYVGGDQ